MNVIVTGGRDYVLTPADYQFLEHSVAMLRAKVILTNGLPGVSAQVESWAQRQGISVQRVTANFMHDGPATPEERNTSLVPLAKAVIAFPGDSASSGERAAWEILKNLCEGTPVNFTDCFVRLDGTGERAVVQLFVDLAGGKTGLSELD